MKKLVCESLEEYTKIQEEMNEDWKTNIAKGLVGATLAGSMMGAPKQAYGQDKEPVKTEITTTKKQQADVSRDFEEYFKKYDFYNTYDAAWEDFVKTYPKYEEYKIKDAMKDFETKVGIFSSEWNKEIPKATNYVSDYAQMVFPQAKEDSLNAKIARYEKSSGVEIAIVTLNYFDDETVMADVAQDVFEEWGIGKKGSDNGILIIFAENTHDWRIHTGYGAEILLPDIAADRLAQSVMIPSFKEGDYTKGIENIVNGLIEKIGTDSEDIEAFKTEQTAIKAERQKAVLNGALWFLGIAAVLTVFGFGINLTYKKYKDAIKLKADTKVRLNEIEELLNKIESTSKEINTSYTRNVLDKCKEIVSKFEEVKGKEPSSQLLASLTSLSSTIKTLSKGVEDYKESYKLALDNTAIIERAKKSLLNVAKLTSYLENYNIGAKVTYSEEHIQKMAETAKSVVETTAVILAVKNMLTYASKISNLEKELKTVKQSIPKMQEALKDYKPTIDRWIRKLKSYSLSAAIKKVEQMTSAFSATLSDSNSKLFQKYQELQDIIAYASGEVRRVEDAIRRKEEEEEEEERARRRRASSYSSSSSYSGGSSFSSGGSSFGGFGGGSSGGGGAGGRW